MKLQNPEIHNISGFCSLGIDILAEKVSTNIDNIRIRIETVENMQNQIVAMVNLQAVDKEI